MENLLDGYMLLGIVISVIGSFTRVLALPDNKLSKTFRYLVANILLGILITLLLRKTPLNVFDFSIREIVIGFVSIFGKELFAGTVEYAPKVPGMVIEMIFRALNLKIDNKNKDKDDVEHDS